MKMQQITIIEETTVGSPSAPVTVELPVDEITVRELIRSHVYQTAKDRNMRNVRPSGPPEQFARDDKEAVLNGQQECPPNTIDWKAEFEKACRAFLKHQILVLVDGQQFAKLDDKLRITPQSDVRFLKLTLLMGG